MATASILSFQRLFSTTAAGTQFNTVLLVGHPLRSFDEYVLELLEMKVVLNIFPEQEKIALVGTEERQFPENMVQIAPRHLDCNCSLPG